MSTENAFIGDYNGHKNRREDKRTYAGAGLESSEICGKNRCQAKYRKRVGVGQKGALHIKSLGDCRLFQYNNRFSCRQTGLLIGALHSMSDAQRQYLNTGEINGGGTKTPPGDCDREYLRLNSFLRMCRKALRARTRRAVVATYR